MCSIKMGRVVGWLTMMGGYGCVYNYILEWDSTDREV